jgi:DNA-binding winged helix-turn-helix (wHTH) protein
MLSPQWHFADFRLDPTNACLWRGAEAVALPPKAFDLLSYLVAHRDRLVTKDELLGAIWPETAVSDAVVRVVIGALRKVLGDTARTPHFIATVPRRGYRFLASVMVVDASETDRTEAQVQCAILALPPRRLYHPHLTCWDHRQGQTPGAVRSASTPRVVRPASARGVAPRTWKSVMPVARPWPGLPCSVPAAGSGWEAGRPQGLHPTRS